ncbi:arsenosugar biosynthesis radical SAM (seleno)protein ArsS [Anaeromyxobacter paludicola]|uniref:Radical SAM/Cys-rich domain protein n=1 Tax=Anaeromyxobacter paludicola TaxID=2918171 RepID=A0ABN6N9U2_9BACT|nr:arsenosugar biosynthesis radical SAM (seleno)protein ArsS [Anaeromyxobacter paludicola]BDG10010.1 radical SAM/Cys-rich domain protein [Anaeromyxobacter paludicola]
MSASEIRADRPFPPLRRERVETLQVNLGYRCNQACLHCHVSAGPSRTEEMPAEVVEDVLQFLEVRRVPVLDVTGGAPELHPGFRALVARARALGAEVIDRCNLTVLEEPGQEELAAFLAAHRVRVVASLPCYSEENVDRQRGRGAYARSIRALRALNRLGYGDRQSGLALDLVYNPLGPSLPPPQAALQRDYERELRARHGIVFDRLLTLANMPVGRFRRALEAEGRLAPYLALLRAAHRDENLDQVMCRRLLSVDWQGFVHDCDFNQLLGIPSAAGGRARPRLGDLLVAPLEGDEIQVGEHCFGCTAGQGSSCSGALAAPPGPPAAAPGSAR